MSVFWSAFCVFFFGYLIMNTLLEYIYYYRRSADAKSWKIQSKVTRERGTRSFFRPSIPLLMPPRKELPNFALFCTLNLINISAFGALATQAVVDNRSFVYWDVDDHGLPYLLLTFFFPITWELIAEYIFHRIMHYEPIYRAWHSYHHLNRAPQVAI